MSGETPGGQPRGSGSGGAGFAGFVLGVIVGGLLGAWFASGGTPLNQQIANAGRPASVAAAPAGVPAKALHPAAKPADPAAAGGDEGRPQTAQAASLVPVKFDMPAMDHRMTIGVFGDSMADGLWAGLYREMRDGKNYDVVRFSQPSTGISRYDYVDVQEKTAGQLATRHVDIAVILFGTNDEQGIIDGRTVYAFNTPGWRQIYTARIDNLISTLKRQGAVVYWVGLPKMGRDGFDQRAGILNAIFAQRAAANGVPFISTVPYTVDAKGGYDAYLPGESGRRVLMRARDGIHMTMAGYMRMASPVTQRIRADVALQIARRDQLGGGAPRRQSRAARRGGLEPMKPRARTGRAALGVVAALTLTGETFAQTPPQAAPGADGLSGAETLAPFFKALEAVKSGARTRPVHIIQLGDSHSAADHITGALRARLQANFGEGGRGALPPGRPFAAYAPRQVEVSQSDGWRMEASFLPSNWTAAQRAAKPGQPAPVEAGPGPFGLSGWKLVSTRPGRDADAHRRSRSRSSTTPPSARWRGRARARSSSPRATPMSASI